MKILAEVLATDGIDGDEESEATGPMPLRSDPSVVVSMASIVEQTAFVTDEDDSENDSQNASGLPLPSALTNRAKEQRLDVDEGYQFRVGLSGNDVDIIDEGLHPMLQHDINSGKSDRAYSEYRNLACGANLSCTTSALPSLLAPGVDSEDDNKAGKNDVNLPNNADRELQRKFYADEHGHSEKYGSGPTEQSRQQDRRCGIHEISSNETSPFAASSEDMHSVPVDPGVLRQTDLTCETPMRAAKNASPECNSPSSKEAWLKSLSTSLLDSVNGDGEGDDDFETLIAAAKSALASPVVPSETCLDRPPCVLSKSTTTCEGKIANHDDVGDDYSIAFLSSTAQPNSKLNRTVKSSNAFANFFRRRARSAGSEDDFPTSAIDPLFDDLSIASDSVYTAGLGASRRKSMRRVMSFSDLEFREIEPNMDSSFHSWGNSDSLGTSRGHSAYNDDDEFSMESEADEIIEVIPCAEIPPSSNLGGSPCADIRFSPNVAPEVNQEQAEVTTPKVLPVRRTYDDLWVDASVASDSIYTKETGRFRDIPFGAEDFDDRSFQDEDSAPLHRDRDTASEPYIIFPMLGLAAAVTDAGTNNKLLDKLSERDDERLDDPEDYSVGDLSSEDWGEDEKAILREMELMKREHARSKSTRKPLLLRYKKSSKFAKISILFAACFTLLVFMGLVGIAVTASNSEDSAESTQSQDGVENPSAKGPAGSPSLPRTPSPITPSTTGHDGSSPMDGFGGTTRTPSSAPSQVVVLYPNVHTSIPTISPSLNENEALAPTSAPTEGVAEDAATVTTKQPTPIPSTVTTLQPTSMPSKLTTIQPTSVPSQPPSISSQPTEPWSFKVAPYNPPTQSPVERTNPTRKCVDDSAASFVVHGKRRDCEWLSKTVAVRLRMCHPSELPFRLCPRTCQRCGKRSEDEKQL